MMKLFLVAALLVALAFAQIPQHQKFTAKFTREEYDVSTNSLVRVTPNEGTMYYNGKGFDASGGVYPERIRFDIPLGGGKTAQIFDIYEDLLIEFSNCDNTCGWKDYYGNAFPVLWTDLGYQPGASVNGWSPTALTQRDNLNEPNSQLVVETATGNVVMFSYVRDGIKLVFTIANGTYVSGDSAFSDSELDVPSVCPDVDPGCFRVDIAFIIDRSGSVGTSNVAVVRDFVIALVTELNVAERYVRVSYIVYSDFADLVYGLTGDKAAFLTFMNTYSVSASGFTSTANGMAVGFTQFLVNGRRSARKVYMVVTDGYPNRPCQELPLDRVRWNCCDRSTSNSAISACDNECPKLTFSGCDSRATDEISYLLTNFATPSYDLQMKRIDGFGIGVGSGIDTSNLLLIANNDANRVFQVSGFAELNTLIDRLLALLLCQVPGAFTCPNDCRPGGWCCGRGCVCLEDCELGGNNCQTGYCSVSFTQGTQCKLTAPDSTQCFDGNPCTTDTCTNDVGCEYVINTDPCNDNNPCTANDTCADAICKGTPDASLSCSDNDVCTNDECVLAGDGSISCESTPVVCVDPDPADCTVFVCQKGVGCTGVVVGEGDLCQSRNSTDQCTVYVCEAGECVERKVDSSECTSQSDPVNPVGPIVGSLAGAGAIGAAAILPPLLALLCCAVLAGLCLALVLCVALTVCLVCLGLIGAVGFSSTSSLAAAASPMVALVDNPLHQAAAAEGTSMAYAADD